MKKILCISMILFGCQQAKDKPDNIISVDMYANTVFSTYVSRPSDGGSGLTLYEDSSYTYGFGSCLVSGSDSGTYSIIADTIYFRSLVADKVDTLNKGHDQITPLTDERFLIRNGRIYYWLKNGKYDMTSFWLKQDLEIEPFEALDSTGEGYTSLYNGNRQTTKTGFFKDFKLHDGEVYLYTPSGEVRKIEIYKNGIKMKDSIF